MVKQVDFPAGERWNGNRECVEFLAIADGERIACAISLEALHDHFAGDDRDPLDVFRENRRAIEGIATRLIHHDRFAADGSLAIYTGDVPVLLR
jgi:hypothetical protein